MNEHLVSYIDRRINKMASFVTSYYIPLDASIDVAYEELLGCCGVDTEAMIAAFRNAVQYLDPHARNNRLDLRLGDERTATLMVEFAPTDKWPIFLFPTQRKLVLNPQGKLGALLATHICVATEWASMKFMWEQLRNSRHKLSVAQITHLLPWLRECVSDLNIDTLPVRVRSKEYREIEREVATIMSNKDVLFFPRLSKELLAIARSGGRLISQYRMLAAASANEHLTSPPIYVEPVLSLVPSWLYLHFEEAMIEWVADQDEYASRAFLREKQKHKK